MRLELVPSGTYAGWILGVHVTAAACFLTTMSAWPGATLALLTIALGVASARDRALLRGARSPRAIEVPASGPASVILANGERVAVRAVRGVGVTRHWVALAPLSLMHRSVMVTAGMLGPESARALRLWSLWGQTPGAIAGQRLT